MKYGIWIAVLLVAGLLVWTTAFSQTPKEKMEPGKAIVSIYHVAPGKHLDFLKWMAAREAIDKEVGNPTGQWYYHTDGDSWDYVAISPQLSDEQDQKTEAAAKAKGLSTGFAANLEFRQFIASHSDTFVRGPSSVSDLVAAAGK